MPSADAARTTTEQPAWAHWLGHLLWDVSARTNGLHESALATSPLTLTSVGILDQISEHKGITIAGISKVLPVSQQAVSQVVSRLEKLGFIERRLSDRGRGVALFVTKAGEQARAEANANLAGHDEELAEIIGRGRYKELVALLEETRDILVRLERPDRPAA